jgi:type I site-specific restriction-modification system R (restriction) subunit
MNSDINEDIVEQATLTWLESLNYELIQGTDIAPDNPNQARKNYSDVILEESLLSSLTTINPNLSTEILKDVCRKIITSRAPDLFEDNYLFHRMLIDGVDIEYTRDDGSIAGDKAYLIDFENIANNSFIAVNQFTVVENKRNRRLQLFGTFSSCKELLRQTPAQANDRKHLRELLSVASGGVIFTTIQKFSPSNGESYQLLSDRRNIIVIADEAHRSQYDFIDGFARHMRDGLPNASFIGFTGTPIELSDKDTYAVFGDNIHTYDIQQAVEDGATVRLYYESRLAKIELNENERPRIEQDFEELTEKEEVDLKEKLKSKWARLEALVGAENRINLIAADIVDHFERRTEAMDGKGMIVCMSRRICVELYKAIIKLRPDWHSDDDNQGFIKVVMTGSASDPEDFQPHVRNKKARDLLAKRAKNPSDNLKLVIVRDPLLQSPLQEQEKTWMNSIQLFNKSFLELLPQLKWLISSLPPVLKTLKFLFFPMNSLQKSKAWDAKIWPLRC